MLVRASWLSTRLTPGTALRALMQIWEASNRGQVLQVEPFKPWEEQAAQALQLTGAPTTQVCLRVWRPAEPLSTLARRSLSSLLQRLPVCLSLLLPLFDCGCHPPPCSP